MVGKLRSAPLGQEEKCQGGAVPFDPVGRRPHEASFIGRRIVLIPPCREHYALLHRWFSDPRSSYLWTNTRRVTSLEQFAFEMDQLLASNLLLLIAGKRNGELQGFVETYGTNPNDGFTSVLVYLAEQRRRLGVGAEALVLLMDYLFTHFPYRKIYADAYEFNRESRSALQNAGFVEEGCLRQHVWYDGRYWDLYKYAFYRELYPKMRERLKRLVPS